MKSPTKPPGSSKEGILHIARRMEECNLTNDKERLGPIPQEYPGKSIDLFVTTEEEGTGRLLAIIYGIVSGHEGKIDPASEAGKGATCTVRLPVLDRGQWTKKDAEEENLSQGGAGGSERQDPIGGRRSGLP